MPKSNYKGVPKTTDVIANPDGILRTRGIKTDGKDLSLNSLPRRYVEGLFTSYLSDFNGFVISKGRCRDEKDEVDIIVTGELECDIKFTEGANGRDESTLYDDVWYYVYVIADKTGKNPVASLASTTGSFYLESDEPSLPSGYTHYRRVGQVYRQSGDFIRFRTEGLSSSLHHSIGRARWIRYAEDYPTKQVLSGGSQTSSTTIDCSALIPDFFGWKGLVLLDVRAAGSDAEIDPPSPYLIVKDGQQVVASVPASPSFLDYQNSSGGGSTDIFILGYQDYI